MSDSDSLSPPQPNEPDDSLFEKKIRPVLAEFVGTTILVFVACLFNPICSNNPLGCGLIQGFAMTFLMVGLGHISGGHFNPAITLGYTLTGALSIVLGLFYFLAQLLGGMLGAAFVLAVYPEEMYKRCLGGSTVLERGVEPGWGVMTEGILTFVVVLTVLLTVIEQKNCQLAPLSVGFAVAVSSSAGFFVTGGSMNPARSLGPAVCYSRYLDVNVWSYHYVYWVGPAAGALVATLTYRLVFAAGSKRIRVHRP
ncbi:aquaporin-8-like [Ostrea edulis]|uniref:aquaporin-8-like n=1 Tax=Ostrea edulis TaxID=37623 RepID=UPI0024AF27B7|nr:aquaporin-8-like [Ostrea edulis]